MKMKVKTIIIISFILASCCASSYQNKKTNNKYIIKFFKSRYKHPVIEKITDDPYKFPRLEYYSVFEEELLAEDPLIPDDWILTSKNNFYRDYDLDKALKEEKIKPSNEEEALQYAVSFIIGSQRGYYWISGDLAASDYIYIPKKYFNEEFFPKVTRDKDTYRISVCFYYPEFRYSGHMYFYHNELVRHEIFIDGYNYKFEDSVVITTELEKEELKLNNLIIEHITYKNLLNDLKKYNEKMKIYGRTDPPDKKLVNRKIEELRDLWEEGFRDHKEEIVPLFKKVISCNPDFVFDSDYICEKISRYQVAKDFGIFDIERLLWKIHKYLSDCVRL